ncbi:hypothetical protein PIB30_086980 [Stylosanthes scabra]|uniref:CCHC-type domain-containing protein n=1 Tax=Stylosanthes scabra TaxID=79078 RepID=A0ABU6WUB4_9FABA|nr:hypothetical protein [Stylosanthes scabra]
MKFEAGLRDDIQLQVSSLGIRNFAELVEKCQRMDDYCKRMATSRNVRTNLPPRNFDRNLAPQGLNFKGKNQPFRNFSHGSGSSNRPNNDGNGNQRQSNAPRFPQGNCYNCEKPGHQARDCLMGKSGPGQPSQRQPAGRVFALNVEEVAFSKDPNQQQGSEGN